MKFITIRTYMVRACEKLLFYFVCPIIICYDVKLTVRTFMQLHKLFDCISLLEESLLTINSIPKQEK